MDWSDRLHSSKRTLTLGKSEIKLSQLAKMATAVSFSSPLIWKAEWTSEALAPLFAALLSGSSIVVINDPNESLPNLAGKEKGWIFLRSSGTEGPSRWISHSQEILLKLAPLYRNKKVAAVLKPGHAAGIEYLLAGIAGDNDLQFCRNAEELSPGVEILHGPPTLLAWLLNFSGKNHELLLGLEKFFSGTDMLHPAIAKKLASTSYQFRIEQLYGTTETWRIPTETHPEKPWLLRFTGNTASLRDGKVSIDSEFVSPSVTRPFTPGDRWVEEEDGWGHLENDRHWVANFHGTKLNLFDIEEKLLQSEAIGDVEIKLQKNFLGQKLKITLFTENESEALEHANSVLQKDQADITVKSFGRPNEGKRKRL